MNKKVDVAMNLVEIKLVLKCLAKIDQKKLDRNEIKIIERLDEVLEEHAYNLEENYQNDIMYFEDKDGYEILTEEGKAILQENDFWFKNDK